jgi:hypothetical protein
VLDAGVDEFGIEAVGNLKNSIDSPANRRLEHVLKTGGVETWFVGRGDSDETFPNAFYIARESGGGSTPDFRIDEVSGKVFIEKNMTLPGSWDTGHLVLGSDHIWLDDAGDLRISPDAPTSATDGSRVSGVQASATFDASTAAIVTIAVDNCTVVYAGVGLYDVAFTAPMVDGNYSVNILPGTSNRAVFVNTKTINGFRIGHTNLAGAFTDAGSLLSFDIGGLRAT